MKKIAITGKLRSGKSVVSDRLFFTHGFEWPIAFGTSLKQFAHEIFPDYAKADAKPRDLYQKFGQLCREIDEDVWIKHAAKSVEYAENRLTTRGIVISDLRQPNEYEWCKRNGFVIVRVSAGLEDRVKRAEIAGDAFELANLEHDTESYVDGFEVDYELVNDGSLDELYVKIDELVAQLQALPSAPPSSA